MKKKLVAFLIIVLIAINAYSQDSIPPKRHSVFVSFNPLLLKKIQVAYNIQFFDDYFNYTIYAAYRPGMYYEVQSALEFNKIYLDGYYYMLGNGIYYSFSHDYSEKKLTHFYSGILLDYRQMEGTEAYENAINSTSKIFEQRVSKFISSKARTKISKNILVELQLDFGLKTEKFKTELLNNKTQQSFKSSYWTSSFALNGLISVGLSF
ncbi:MAG: hypothetical protein RIQ33_2590 [Bacteroidota bacterium]|jgi:hypothetical protein